jgi:NADH-quinone oxidoreductase subunit E
MPRRLRQRADGGMIFKDTYEDLTPRQLEYIIERFEGGKGDTVKTGPQIDRMTSAPFGGLTSLTEDPTTRPSGLGPRIRKPPRQGEGRS